jgi:hypothetical protein
MTSAATITIPEIAKLLGISRNAAYEAAGRGELLGVIRLGRRVVVARAILLAALGLPTVGSEPSTCAPPSPKE